ncbi:MAG: hypothetical protein A2Z93_01355 [Curvibacter sp. GWA2_64_110]|nr:MAG: hypothetical protein A2Z93_01355 [Curvibacter sp. GWA2_64_110]HCY15579.1 hypothetical protein [Curvibacter sp.]
MWFSEAKLTMASSPRPASFVRDWFARHPKWLAGLQYTVSTLVIGLLLAGATVLVTRLEAQLPSPFKLAAAVPALAFSALG